MDYMGLKPINLFITYFLQPLYGLDDNRSTEKLFNPYKISTQSEGGFMAYVNSNKELMFAYEKNSEKNPKKNINTIFYPNEIDHMIKGIFIQAAKMRGRTSPEQLIDILEYRFSDQFEIDRNECLSQVKSPQ